jgi:hypothetical protein
MKIEIFNNGLWLVLMDNLTKKEAEKYIEEYRKHFIGDKFRITNE